MKEKKEPFNDVIDHFNKIEGNATDPSNAKLKKLPKPIRYIGYFTRLLQKTCHVEIHLKLFYVQNFCRL